MNDICIQLVSCIAERVASSGHTLFVGISGAQGSGKSTIAARLHDMLGQRGVRSAVLSLDDVYLARAERNALAQSVHPLLRTRGAPGTHDVGLALCVLEALSKPGTVQLPAFEKA